MAAATTKLLRHPKTLATTAVSSSTSIHFFSSSSGNSDPNNNPAPPQPQPQPQNPPSFSSYFNELKANLKQQPPPLRNPQQSQPPPRKPFPFASNQRNPPSKAESLEEIRKNLAEFRSRTIPPSPPPLPPTSSSSSSSSLDQNPNPPKPISFQELYKAAREKGSPLDAPNPRASFDSIRDSLKYLHSSKPTNNWRQKDGRVNNPLPLRPVSQNVDFRPPKVIGGTEDLPLNIFGPEIKKEEEEADDSSMRTAFLRTWTYNELGERLRALRPEQRDKKDWFSLEELNERLVKLREMEKKEEEMFQGTGIPFHDLRKGLSKLVEPDKKRGPSKSETYILEACIAC